MSTESPRPEPAKSKRDAETEIPLLTAIEDTRPTERLSVHISYEIIKLFSEGLYKSPHKAIEELVA
ncbi:hypothetical protein KDL45_13290, partial [bacterium]|nr:hypothetical protein [bacterium]